MKTYPVILAMACAIFTITACFGQTGVNTVSTVNTITVAGGTNTATTKSHPNSVNTVLPNTNYSVKYNNNGNVSINSFALSGKTYVKFGNFDTVIFRRVANAWETTGGNKQQIYVQGNALVDNLTFNMPFPAAFPVVTGGTYMQRVMEDGYINRGSDNVFNNDSTSDLTYNNIERVDFVYKVGVATTGLSMAGFLIAERGGNDDFKIAAITGVDAVGNPTSFGPVLSVKATAYGNAIMTASTYVMRKDVADGLLRPFSLVGAQAIKAVFIRLTDLSVGALQKIYGYSLMADDVTATTSAQLLAFTNATYFPRNTTTSDGGMDLAAAPGIFHTDLILENENIALTSRAQNCSQILQWRDENYTLAKEYEVQQSSNGSQFKTLSVVPATTSDNSYIDRNSVAGYYRIKAIMNSGKEVYSGIIHTNSPCGSGRVSLFPNPAKDMVTISYDATMRIRQVTILSVTGKKLGTWNVNETSSQIQMDIATLPQGQYFVETKDANGGRKAYPFMKL